MSLHLKGSQLVVDLLDAADHIDRIEREEHRALLRRAAETLATLQSRTYPISWSIPRLTARAL